MIENEPVRRVKIVYDDVSAPRLEDPIRTVSAYLESNGHRLIGYSTKNEYFYAELSAEIRWDLPLAKFERDFRGRFQHRFGSITIEEITKEEAA